MRRKWLRLPALALVPLLLAGCRARRAGEPRLGASPKVKSEDLTLVTSGDYERYFMKDGVRYHHIFDPRTGEPARRSISATIIGKSSTEGDILSTAVFVLGPEEGLDLVRRVGNVEA